MDDLISIGEFAAASGLSPRALRLYEKKRILRPVHVDPANGYRWYATSQLQAATIVRLARAMSMPLDEIAGLLEDPPEDAHRRLDRHWSSLQAGLIEAREALGVLHRMMVREREGAVMSEFERGNRLYFEDRNIEEALRAYENVAEDDPNHVKALRYIGHNIYGREWGRWEQGLPYLERALSLAPEDPKLLEDIGRAYIAVGRSDEGTRLLEQAGTPVARRALMSLSGGPDTDRAQ